MTPQDAEQAASLMTIFGSVDAYNRSLPMSRWYPSGRVNEYGRSMWTTQPPEPE